MNVFALRILDLRYNVLRAIPAGINEYVNLWRLHIDNNLIDTLNNQVFELPCLEVFTASHNRLVRLHDDVGCL